MISFVCYLWRGEDPRRVFLPEHVNTLAGAIARVYPHPHRFLCVADEQQGLAAPVEWVRTPPEATRLANIRTLEGTRFPSCYRRLWGFSRAARELLGERIMVIDIDLVPVRDFAHLARRPEPFVGWRPLARWGQPDRLGGGIYLMEGGAHPEVFERFNEDPIRAQLDARAAGYRGSDQAWISFCLGRQATVWPDNVGIYSIRDMLNGRLPLPADACLVQFNGPAKPWQSSLPWVREHWR